jgi:hypothetical protein
MSGNTTAMLAFILLLAALVFGAIQLMRFLFRRAVRTVVSLLRERGATSPAGAKTPQELGLAPKTVFDRMFRMRDYRQDALRVLGEADIVRVTETGAIYLSEAALERSPLKELARIK